MDICERDEQVDELYGLYEIEFSEDEIKALLAGKKLYTDIGYEYAITIVLGGE